MAKHKISSDDNNILCVSKFLNLITGYCGRLRLLTRGQLTDPSLNSLFTKTTTRQMPTEANSATEINVQTKNWEVNTCNCAKKIKTSLLLFTF